MQYLTQLLTQSPTKRSRDSEQAWLYPRQLSSPDPVLTALQVCVAARARACVCVPASACLCLYLSVSQAR